MPPRNRWTPDRNTWETRLVYLIQDRGIKGVSRLTKRSPRTIRSWLREGRTPSAAIRRSLARQGRDLAPSTQSRPGQPAQIVPPRITALERQLREDAQRRRRRRTEAATTPALRDAAQALDIEEEVDANLLDSLSSQMNEMLRREAEGERVGQGSELYEEWEEWREEIEAEYRRLRGDA